MYKLKKLPKNHVRPELVNMKAVVSGNVIEIYNYTEGYLQGYEDKIKKSGRKADYISEDHEENRDKTLQRARTNLKRIINSNVNAYGNYLTPKFLTLTFKENLQDLDIAHNRFKKFIQRLNYFLYGDKKARLKYSAVVEFQDRGAIHYHMVLYNMKYVPASKLNEIWTHGYEGNINIKKIHKVDDIGSYLCKYMTKENENPILLGRKCYFNSRGLKTPTIITDKKRVEALLQALPLKHLKYRSQFENEYTGVTNYYHFNTKYSNDAIDSYKYNLSNVSLG